MNEVPAEIWEIAIEFSQMARERKQEVNDACCRYLAIEAEYYRKMTEALPNPEPDYSDCPPEYTKEELEQMTDKQKADYQNKCRRFEEEQKKHLQEYKEKEAQWLKDNPDPDELTEEDKNDPESKQTREDQAVTTLACLAQHVAERELDKKIRNRFFKLTSYPKDVPVQVLWETMDIPPELWTQKVEYLKCLWREVKERWEGGGNGNQEKSEKKETERRKNGEWQGKAIEIITREMEKFNKGTPCEKLILKKAELARAVGVSPSTVSRHFDNNKHKKEKSLLYNLWIIYIGELGIEQPEPSNNFEAL